MTNLLDNAERHGHGQDVELIADVSDNTLDVSILDRGPGMSAEELKIATRTDLSLDRAAGGSGLGL